jgi:hypothetical protein
MAITARQKMEATGFKLAKEGQPGIYVRRDEIIANDPIDWTSEPIDLKKKLKRFRKKMNAKARRRALLETE